MKYIKLALIIMCVIFSIDVRISAQPIQPLPPNLELLKPVNVFPVNADTAFRFIDRSKGNKPAISNTNNKNISFPVFSTEVFTSSKSHYDIQTVWKTTAPVKKGDALLARFSIRSIYAKQESGEAVVYFFVQKASGASEKSVIVDISAGPEWKTIEIPFNALLDMNAGDGAICFSYAALAQKVEITNVQVLNFAKQASLAQLPVTRFTYQGREENARWREEALKRIEEIRTAPIVVTVTDAYGKPVKEARVNVQLVQSDFIWGTSVNEAQLGKDLPTSASYKTILKELFNTAVIENGFKAGSWQGRPETRPVTMKAFNWLVQQGFRQRGHNLVWPGWKFNPLFVKELAQKDTAAFRSLIETGIKDRMDSIKERVVAWDVINELVHEKDFFPYLPNDIVVQWFKTAKKQDPKAQLFINEYGMLNSIASPNNIPEYINVITELRKAGAPIEAIGVQGHVGRQPRNPAQVITDLDLFEVTGLPVQITEFDINMSDEELQADYTRDFLIACYSHPAVTGFTIWGFWQGAHWKPDAAMFRNDWSAKPNAAVWREWVTKKWKTSFTQATGADGKIISRGHLGRYEITASKNGTEKKVSFHLTKNGEPVEIKL